MQFSYLNPLMLLSFISFFFFAPFLFDSSNIIFSLFLTATASIALFFIIFLTEWMIKKTTLKSFAFICLGLLVGLFVGESLILFSSRYFPLPFLQSVLVQGIFCLCASFVGVRIAQLAANEFFPTILGNVPTPHKKIIIELSALVDSRFIDLAATGIFDHQLILPAFVIKDLQMQLESIDEALKGRGRKGLENLKKLEAMPQLNLKIENTSPLEAEDYVARWVKLAGQFDAFLLTSDSHRFQSNVIDEVKILNINTLSNILKPLNVTGEPLLIKIQRYGKEPRQGVGYLEDGTMVVVNGGGEHIGETIRCFVLSIKHTSSGRMIFCNVAEEETGTRANPLPHLETSAKHFYAV